MLLGHDGELAALQALLAGAHLVTLAGSGGIGKTRLAQAALAAWPEGGVWVELAALAAADPVAAAVARALGIAAGPQPLDAVAASLAATPRLVVLDNAEHVLAGVVALAGALQAQAPQARLLVTSQEVLRLPQEQVLRLAPLALPAAPGLAAAQASGAVALFLARARAADRGAWGDALASCRRARPLLEIEGDDLLLLPVLAACALGQGRADAAARIAGHLHAQQVRSGTTPWPAEAAVRARLQLRPATALSPGVLEAALEAGATLSRTEALALGFATG